MRKTKQNTPDKTTIYHVDFRAARVTRIVEIDYKQKSFTEREAEILREINSALYDKRSVA